MDFVAKMPILISNLNPKAATLNIVNRENLIYITKLGLLLSVTQYVNSRQIFDDIHINNSTTTLDIELNL